MHIVNYKTSGILTSLERHTRRWRYTSKNNTESAYLKFWFADRLGLVAGVSAVWDVVAEVVDVDALLVLAVPLELFAALGRLSTPAGFQCGSDYVNTFCCNIGRIIQVVQKLMSVLCKTQLVHFYFNPLVHFITFIFAQNCTITILFLNTLSRF